MTRDEMIDYFMTKAGRYFNCEEHLIYIKGQSDKLVSNVKLFNNHFDKSDFKPIIKELNGENSEMAKRILYAASKTQHGTFCKRHILDPESIRFLIRIGYDFDEILHEVILKGKGAISKLEYNTFAVLYEYYPQKVEQYADEFFNADSIAQFKNAENLMNSGTKDFYLGCLCAVLLLNINEKKYEKFKPMLAEYFEKIPLYSKDYSLNKSLIFILFKGFKHDKVLFERLKNAILENYYVSYYLEEVIIELDGANSEDKYLDFLKENSIKTYPYYVLVALFSGQNKQKKLRELIKKDKETFLETFEYIKKVKTHKEEVILCLLALIINNDNKNKEGRELLGEYKYLYRKITQSINNTNAFDLIISGGEDADKYLETHYSSYAHDIEIFGVLYDFDDEVKKFIDTIIQKKKAMNLTEDLFMIVSYFLEMRNKWLNTDMKKDYERIFSGVLEIQDLFRFLCFDVEDNIFDDEFINVFAGKYEEEVLDFINDDFIKGDIDGTLIWLDYLCYHTDFDKYNVITSLLNNKSKKIQNFCENYLVQNEEIFRSNLENDMAMFKNESLKIVKRVIKVWDNEHKYGNDFNFKDNNSVIEFVDDNYDADNEKLTSWVDEMSFENVRFKGNGENVPAKVIRFIFNEYMALTRVYRIKYCDKIIDKLNIDDFRKVAGTLFNLWLEEGSDIKKKNIGIPYCIYSSDSTILSMRSVLETWAKASRGAVAAYMVNAIALNGGKAALMMIASISNKFPNSKVKKTAQSAIKYAAKVLEIPEDALSDKIVPDLGFDKYGEKIIDYGTRTFQITLKEDFTLSIFDNEKKKIVKSLPKPNNSDDIPKAESAKKEFSTLKKQLKEVIKNQTERLKTVFTDGRTWNTSAWKELFVENPIMQMFARSLIWGTYHTDNDKEDKLLGTFRYMEDGTLNAVDEEEFIVPEDACITLVHPCELTEGIKNKWNEQLKDYEIIQPFLQMNAAVNTLKDEDVEEKAVIKYENKETTAGILAKMIKKYNLQRGEIYDGGIFNSYHFIDKYLNIGVRISFEDMYVEVEDYDETIDIGDIVFYRLAEDFEDEIIDDIDESLVLEPKVIPNRFVSSILEIADELVSIR